MSSNSQPDSLLKMLRSGYLDVTGLEAQFGRLCGAVQAGENGTLQTDTIKEALGVAHELMTAVDNTVDALERLKAQEEMRPCLQRATDKVHACHHPEAVKIVDAMVTSAEARFGSNSVCLADVLEAAAKFFYNLGDRERHLQLLERAAHARRGAVRVKSELAGRQLALADTLTRLAAVYARHGKRVPARDAAEEALYHWEHNLPPTDNNVIEARQNLAYYNSL